MSILGVIASKAVESGEQKISPFAKCFLFSAGAILAVTGIAKVWSGLGNSKLLTVSDPITGIKFGHLMLVVGILEIAAALVCFFSKRRSMGTWFGGLVEHQLCILSSWLVVDGLASSV